ncbi:MAG: hypothetical protein ACOY4Q_08525, partial [Bacillota bacterium]
MRFSQALGGFLQSCRKKRGRGVFKKFIAVLVLVTFIVSTANVTAIPQAFAAEQEITSTDKPADYVAKKPSYTSVRSRFSAM